MVKTTLRRGTRVFIPWGLASRREATVVDIWGDPDAPSQVRVELIPLDDEDLTPTLLLGPDVVSMVR